MSNVAILYSGQPRDFIKCWPNHKEYLMSSFCAGTTVAIFAHFWNYNFEIEEFVIDVVTFPPPHAFDAFTLISQDCNS